MSHDEIVSKEKNNKLYKVIVVGDSAVGKSELINRFITNSFEEKYIPTVVASFSEKSVELSEYSITVNLSIWEIAGGPKYNMINSHYFYGATGMLLVFDVTRSSTFGNINNWYSSAEKFGLSGIPKVLIGNNAHLIKERTINLPMAKKLAEKLNAPYYETSTLNGVNVNEAFEKIAELVYRAQELNDNWSKEPLIVKPYEESIPDKVEDISLISSSPSIELDRREKRALETVFRHFQGSILGRSQSMPITTTEMGDFVILTSKYKLQTLLAFIYGFFFIYLFWFFGFFLLPTTDDERAYGLGLTASGVRILLILLIILVLGIGGRLIVFALNLRHYFIVLHHRGIYYKKIGKPRFLSWADIDWIEGYQRYVQGRPTERAVKIHLKSNKKVRFNSTNYLFKDKFFALDDVFYSCKFRTCPFYSTQPSSYRFYS